MHGFLAFARHGQDRAGRIEPNAVHVKVDGIGIKEGKSFSLPIAIRVREGKPLSRVDGIPVKFDVIRVG